MGTIWVRELKGGLDARRLPETTEGGVLVKGEEGHITSGGEFEKRAAFVKEYDLPAGTVNLAADASGLIVFGHAAEPAEMPDDVTYQRLEYELNELVRVKSFDLFAGSVYAVGEYGDGSIRHFYDGTIIPDWPDGRARGSFTVTGATGGTIRVYVDGVEATSGAVSWTTSNAETATDIADNINAHTSTPEYTAVASGSRVSIVAPLGADANGRVVTFTLASGFTIDETTVTLAGGMDISGSPGTYVRTFGSKVHTVAGPLEVFSTVNDPTNWSTGVGFGFVDMSQQTSGMEDLVALAEYQDKLAVFAERVIQLWTFVSDPTASVKGQTLRNTGTSCPRSVVKWGDQDVFFMDESGIRSLRARDSSLAPSTSDIGVYIDPLVTAKLGTLTDTERKTQVIGLIEPVSGRLWMILKDVIYVFSFYAGSKVSAWTIYTPHYFDGEGERVDFDVDDAVVWNRRVYLRSGDEIFVYGGIETGAEYDETQAVAWLPYLDAETPWQPKAWTGWDAAVEGEWIVSAAMSLADQTVADQLGTIDGTSYNHENLMSVGKSTHLSLRFTSQGDGAAKLSACALHFEDPPK